MVKQCHIVIPCSFLLKYSLYVVHQRDNETSEEDVEQDSKYNG